jgi:hypothetical protein
MIVLRSLPVLALYLGRDHLFVSILLEGHIGCFDCQGAVRAVTESKLEVVLHTDGKIDGVLLEIDNKSLAIEVALVVRVHLDAGVAVDALIDYTVPLEDLIDLLGGGIAGDISDVDGAILLKFRLLLGLGLQVGLVVKSRNRDATRTYISRRRRVLALLPRLDDRGVGGTTAARWVSQAHGDLELIQIPEVRHSRRGDGYMTCPRSLVN